MKIFFFFEQGIFTDDFVFMPIHKTGNKNDIFFGTYLGNNVGLGPTTIIKAQSYNLPNIFSESFN